ncbi:hypothetical protein [Prosthecomicrobium sp. N25]|uniref:hypothetical protein n=1 Tax=Prosthecomicrobium sp. N25 TaxID=3129254 RepID=UPI0030776B28
MAEVTSPPPATLTPAEHALVLVTASAARRPAAETALAAGFGTAPPAGPEVRMAGSVAILGLGPGRWLLAAPDATGPGLLARAGAALGATALATDQSDARAVFRLAGPRLADLLERITALDPQGPELAVGAAAATDVMQCPAWLWRPSADAILAAVPRSYAADFERTVAQAAATLAAALAAANA